MKHLIMQFCSTSPDIFPLGLNMMSSVIKCVTDLDKELNDDFGEEEEDEKDTEAVQDSYDETEVRNTSWKSRL
jgi:hypothetical protein